MSMNTEYQEINIILNVAELISMTILASVFLFNRINITKQYVELIVRLDSLLAVLSGNTLREKRQRKQKEQDN
jgi:hypothetical protein